MSWLAWAAMAYACGAILTGLYLYATLLAPINTIAVIRNALLWPAMLPALIVDYAIHEWRR